MSKSIDLSALDIDLLSGVVPISKAASNLAMLLARSRANQQPIVVTQKGRPTGVILDIETFEALRRLARLSRLDLPGIG